MISPEGKLREMERQQNSWESYLLCRWNSEKQILSQPKFTIGRSLHNSYVLEHLQVSRTHCILQKVDQNWYVTDESSNGTLLNKKMIAPRTQNILSNGDIIKITDKHEFIFVNIKRNSLDDMDLSAIIDEPEVNLINSNAQNRMLDTNEVVDIDSKTNTENKAVSTVIKEHTYCANTNNEPAVETIFSIKPEISKSESANKEIASTSSSSNKLPENTNLGLHAFVEAENELQCIICTELFIKAITLNCSHSFCKACIEEWRKKNKKCPICRTKITTANPTIVLDNFITKIIESSSNDVKEKRQEIVKSREQSEKEKGTTSRSGRALRSTAAPPIEISSEEEDSYDEDDEDFIDDGNDYEYTGLPGRYYGGYGHCYSCGERGHWANGCPYN